MIISYPSILTDKSRLDEVYELRVKVYGQPSIDAHVHKQYLPGGWKDSLDECETAIHWIIEDNDQIIASARLVILSNIEDTHEEFQKLPIPDERPFAYWSRLAVDPNYRMSDAVQKLDKARMHYILEHPEIKFAICCVTPERESALLKLNFEHIGDIEYTHPNGNHSLNQPVFIYIA